MSSRRLDLTSALSTPRPRLDAVCLALSCLVTLAVAPAALADDRYFPFGYPYNTAEQGERELELYTDLTGDGLENQLEFEYGATDRLTLAASGLLHNFNQFDGWKLEGRYRLAEKNVLPVDTGLYLEGENAMGEGPTVEYKLLLEKSLGRWIIDANLIGERHFVDNSNEFGATLGAGYPLSDSLVAGLETRYNAQKLYVGPTLAAFMSSFHLTGGVYYGGANELLGRLVAAQEF